VSQAWLCTLHISLTLAAGCVEMAWTDESTLSHSLFRHMLAPIAVVRRDQSNDFNMGTTSQAAMTNSIDKQH